MSIPTYCNEGCNQSFTIYEFKHEQLSDEIEKTTFTCPHCGHEYVVNHTNAEISKLQERVRRVHRRFADPADNHEDAAKKEADIQQQIKQKMDALRQRIENSE